MRLVTFDLIILGSEPSKLCAAAVDKSVGSADVATCLGSSRHEVYNQS